ncbi:uncharacterized protein LOC117176281 isoform X2 [Belonocnema kinseyi]|nr:uncharacterized protein LOC117176281 isoform X2 [Belonocnema kinseyi]XP_033222373.1 uncharacterized protein LOC117176281 isoform X2 [Belonocnema kinseyi]
MEFITKSTCYGLKVTLKAALELSRFLIEDCNFDFARSDCFNQDYLEKFFGLRRESCRANDNPDSSLFIQMFRLVSTYSLRSRPRDATLPRVR